MFLNPCLALDKMFIRLCEEFLRKTLCVTYKLYFTIFVLSSPLHLLINLSFPCCIQTYTSLSSFSPTSIATSFATVLPLFPPLPSPSPPHLLPLLFFLLNSLCISSSFTTFSSISFSSLSSSSSLSPPLFSSSLTSLLPTFSSPLLPFLPPTPLPFPPLPSPSS